VDAHPTASRFRTTSWTLIRQARASRDDLETLLGRYWSPVYAWLRRRGHASHDAADLTQAFLCEVVLKRDLIGKADPDLGRFRSYLLTALKRFQIDAHRKSCGRNGQRPSTYVPNDPEAWKTVEPCEEHNPTEAFDRQWATAVFNEALIRAEALCLEQGMEKHWRAYEAKQLRPALHGTQAMNNDSVATLVNARSPEEVSSLIHSAKRKFRMVLKEVVAETLDDPREVDEELATLQRLLSP
jgi:RNA polymerase sigma-70 factor (ECF subfamily)